MGHANTYRRQWLEASVAGFGIRRFQFSSRASLDEGMTHPSSQM